jgi:hypothetical protein
MTKHILVTGDPGTGFNHIGPFYDLEAATRYADNSLGDANWWLLELDAPDGDEHDDFPLKPKPERPNHDDFITVLTTLRYIAIWEKDQYLFESANRALAGCGKSRHFGKTVMKWARPANSVLIKSMCYEGAKGDKWGWKHHRPTFSAAC